eukprot:GDKH01020480.1.p1 GENE.GDKH01020480.1~~GDKH01020480.1.p1  ORF type:complete len:513 (-),score=67.44 GDKH01020480.1:118-1656(-)
MADEKARALEFVRNTDELQYALFKLNKEPAGTFEGFSVLTPKGKIDAIKTLIQPLENDSRTGKAAADVESIGTPFSTHLSDTQLQEDRVERKRKREEEPHSRRRIVEVAYAIPQLENHLADDDPLQLKSVPLGTIFVSSWTPTRLTNRKEITVSEFTQTELNFLNPLIDGERGNFNRIAGESGLHCIVDTLLKPYRWAIEPTSRRDQTDESTKAAFRPDFVDKYLNVSILHGEEKSDAAQLHTAQNELIDKLAPYTSAIFGRIPWFLGLAVADDRFALLSIRWTGAKWESQPILRGSFQHAAVDLQFMLLRFATLVRSWEKRQMLAAPHSGVCWGEQLVRHDGRTVITLAKLSDEKPAVKKTYSCVEQMSFEGLTDLGQLWKDRTIQKRWPHSLEWPVIVMMRNGKIVTMTRPVCGIKPTNYRLSDVAADVREALKFLHEHSFVHCDVRIENVLCNCDESNRETFVLVDLEYVRKIGSPAPLELRTLRNNSNPFATLEDDRIAFKEAFGEDL